MNKNIKVVSLHQRFFKTSINVLYCSRCLFLVHKWPIHWNSAVCKSGCNEWL